jgi:two-component sensor histidine kinase
MAHMQFVGNNATSDQKSEPGPMEVSRRPEGSSPDLIFVQEMIHRINNQMTSTISFASQAAARSCDCDVKVALAGVIEHLLDYARVYRALQMPTVNRSIDAAQYLRDLCRAISRATLQHRGIDLVLVERPLQLSSAQCWILGMIITELITNACRHAFAENGGSIKVEFERRGCRVECRVADDGSAKENIRPRQGLRIIQHLTARLNGEISQRFGETGSIAIVSFPIVEPMESS